MMIDFASLGQRCGRARCGDGSRTGRRIVIEYPSERIPCRVFSRASDASVAAATEIAELIRWKADVANLRARTGCRLVARQSLRRTRPAAPQGSLSFENVVTFNLGEYLPDAAV